MYLIKPRHAFKGSIGRTRVVPIVHLAKAHTNAPETLRKLASYYSHDSRVQIQVMNNLGDIEDITPGTLADLPSKSYNENERGMLDEARKQLESGAIVQSKFDRTTEGISGTNVHSGGDGRSDQTQGNEPAGTGKEPERTEQQSPVTPKAQSDKPAVSANTIFTEDAAAAARARLKSKLHRLNSGIDPETMMDGITLAGYHIEKGARTFAAYSKAMIDDLGDAVKPYLKSWYMGVKYDPRGSKFDGMDGAASVESADVDAIALEKPANNADNVNEDTQNATRKLDSSSPSTLAGIPTETVSGTGEVRSTESSTDTGSGGNAEGTGHADGSGVQAQGSLGASEGVVPVSTGGTGNKRGSARQSRVSGNARRKPRAKPDNDGSLFAGIENDQPLAPNAEAASICPGCRCITTSLPKRLSAW